MSHLSVNTFSGSCELTVGDTKIAVSNVEIQVQQDAIDVTTFQGPSQSIPGLRRTSISASCATTPIYNAILRVGTVPIRLQSQSYRRTALIGNGRVVKIVHRTPASSGYVIEIEGTDFYYEAVDDLREAFARAQEQAAREKDAAVAVAATVARR